MVVEVALLTYAMDSTSLGERDSYLNMNPERRCTLSWMGEYYCTEFEIEKREVRYL